MSIFGLQAGIARQQQFFRNLTATRYRYIRNIIRASRMRGITNYRVRVLVDNDISSYFTSGRSTFLYTISSYFIRFETRSTFLFSLASLLSRSRFYSPTSDSRGSGRGPRASVYRYSNNEGSLFSIGRLIIYVGRLRSR